MAGTPGRGRSLLSRLTGAGDRPRRAVAVRRRRFGAVCLLDLALHVPAAKWPAVATALAAAVADAASGHATLVRVGLVDAEPPFVAAFATRRDLVAPQVRGALTAGASHRRPHLWLALAPGIYAANALDPDAPFAASPEVVAAMLASGVARAALRTEATPERRGVLLRVEVYGAPGVVRSALRSGRAALAPLVG